MNFLFDNIMPLAVFVILVILLLVFATHWEPLDVDLDDGWLPHDGSHRPLKLSTEVQVEHRDGRHSIHTVGALMPSWLWTEELSFPSDIVRYRALPW